MAQEKTAGGRMGEILVILNRHQVYRGMTPEKLRAIIEDLGPTFVKLGQILSMRRDMLPAAYCEALESLRADARPFPTEDAVRQIETELKKPLNELFADFNREPIGSASIAQAYRAKTLAGEDVVVKVQRIGIFETMREDIGLLRGPAGLLKLTEIGQVVDMNMVLDEMWAIAQQEMDFLQEAENLRRFARENGDGQISCPRVYGALTTARVLTMEYVDGCAFGDRAAFKKNGWSLEKLGDALADNYVSQIIDHGFFHADPHQGNIRVRDGKIVWIDLGMMGTLSERDRKLIREAVRGVIDYDVDKLKSVVLQMGVYSGRIDQMRLRGDIEDFLNRYGSMELGGMNLGGMVEDLSAVAKKHGISLPKGMTMLGRGALTIEGVLAEAAPGTSVTRILAARMQKEIFRDLDVEKELTDSLRKLTRSTRKAAELPAQLTDALRLINSGQVKLNLELTGAEPPAETLKKETRRLVTGLFGAALTVGSALVIAAGILAGQAAVPAIGAVGLIGAAALAIWSLKK